MFEVFPGGWIKLHRKLLSSPVWKGTTPAQKILAVACLLLASHDDTSMSIGGERINLEAGTFWTSLPALSKATGLNPQQIRTSLTNLKNLDFLTYDSTAKGRKITIINWHIYQSKDEDNNRQDNRLVTDWQQTDNRLVTGIKNGRMEEDSVHIYNKFLDEEDSTHTLSSPRKTRVKKTKQTPKQNVWKIWVDCNHDLGRLSPERVGPDINAVKQLQEVGKSDEAMKTIMKHYLLDDDQYLKRLGHPLRELTRRINRYVQFENLQEGLQNGACAPKGSGPIAGHTPGKKQGSESISIGDAFGNLFGGEE